MTSFIIEDLSDLQAATKIWRDIAVEQDNDPELHRLANWLQELVGVRESLAIILSGGDGEEDEYDEYDEYDESSDGSCQSGEVDEDEGNPFPGYGEMEGLAMSGTELNEMRCPRCRGFTITEDGAGCSSCGICGWRNKRDEQ